MTAERDYEKELTEFLVAFRQKCSELNVTNDLLAKMEGERKLMYEASVRTSDEYNRWYECEVRPVMHKLNETRSELQAMQASALDMLIEMMTKGKKH